MLWYGPLYLLANYGQYATVVPAGTASPLAGLSANNAAVTGVGAAATGEYTVTKGDTLSKIARKFMTTIKDLIERNGIKNPNKIYPGQKLSY